MRSIVLMAVFLCTSAFGATTNFYVSPTGSSTNNGLTTNATWQFVYALANAGVSNTIIVMDGDYSGVEYHIQDDYQTIRAQNKWKARLINSPSSGIYNDLDGSVVGIVLDGLVVSNSAGSGIILGGDNGVVQNCWVTRAVSGSGINLYPGNGFILRYNLTEYNGNNVNQHHGLYVGGTNTQLYGNVSRYNAAGGISLGLSGWGSDNIEIHDNLLYYSRVAGIAAGGVLAGSRTYFYNNTVIGTNTGRAFEIQDSCVIRATNNIIIAPTLVSAQAGSFLLGDYNVLSAQSPLIGGIHNIITNTTGCAFVNTNAGLWWVKSSSPVRGFALTTAYKNPNFFGTNRTSVSDVGAFQYSSAQAADTRTLDPSPAGGANYWLPLNFNYFVNARVGSSGNGLTWSTAWKQPSNITGVLPGDVVWFAGGSNYTVGFSPTWNGSSSEFIYFKRATTNDYYATNTAGWNSAFDSQVITPEIYWNSAANGSYLYFDGRKTNGWQFQAGSSSFDSGAWVFRQDTMHDIYLTNCDAVGPGGLTPFNHQGDCGALSFRSQGSGVVSNVFIYDALMQGYPNIIYNLGGNHNVRLTRVQISRNGSSNGSIHANILYTGGGNYDFYFVNCDIANWQVEGFNWYQQPAPNYPYYFVGCVFHDPMDQSVHSCFWPASEPDGSTPQGPIHMYNCTFSNVSITTSQGRTSQFGSTSTCSNNIFWTSSFNANSAIPTRANYNFSSGSTPGANSISSGSNPFVGYFQIVSNIAATYPRDKGIALPANIVALGGNVDANGIGRSTFPSMGAFEFSGALIPTISSNLNVRVAYVSNMFKLTP